MEFDAIVLAGGSAVRMGGIDKVMAEVEGMPLLAGAVRATSSAARIVVAGPDRALRLPAGIEDRLTWVEESPAGSGPVHAIAAALACVTAGVVAVVAADMPFVDETTIERLVGAAAGGGLDGAIALDEEERDQPLLAAYRTGSLRAALDRLPATPGAPAIGVIAALTVIRVPVGRAAFDCDTPEALAAARGIAR